MVAQYHNVMILISCVSRPVISSISIFSSHNTILWKFLNTELLEYFSRLKMADENERINTKNSENKSLRGESHLIEETTFYIDGDEFEVINIVKTENEDNVSCESNCSLWAIGENSELRAKENDSVKSGAKVSEQNPELSNGKQVDRKNLGPVKTS